MGNEKLLTAEEMREIILRTLRNHTRSYGFDIPFEHIADEIVFLLQRKMPKERREG